MDDADVLNPNKIHSQMEIPDFVIITNIFS